MKRKILVLVTVVLSLLLAISVSTFAVSAEEAEPSGEIAKFNLAFEDNTYLKYAVRFDGVADSAITENNIGMLYWTDYEGGFVPGTEDFSSKTTGYTEISGVKHYVFEYTHLAAKQLTDYVYSVAYLEYDGETYYSEPVKYSALEYAYNRLGKTSEGSTNTELKALLNNMLAYGASAQQYFNYKEDRLATADFFQLNLVGGTLEDGFTSGLYLSTDEIVITSTESCFKNWINDYDQIVSADNPATVKNLSANTTYTASDKESVKYSQGLSFDSNGDGTCDVSGIGTCTDTEVVIPPTSPLGDSVTGFAWQAFSYCTALTNVVIPDSVTSISSRAFYGCSSLTSVVIGDSVTSIGSEAFSRCSSLTSVVIGDSVTSIGNSAFNGCSSLTSVVIPDNVASIGSRAFYECTLLTSVVIGNGVTSIGSEAFYRCTSLTSIEIPDSVTSIGSYAFSGCSSLESIVIPYSVTSIGNASFYGCTNLEEVFISEGCVSIGDSAFSECTKLSNVVIPETITNFGSDVFGGCDNIAYKESNGAYYLGTSSNPYHILITSKSKTISTLNLNENTKVIAKTAFKDCNTLRSIVFPDNVVSIGDYAFYGCTALKTIVVPDSVMEIGGYAFSKCTGLVSVDIGKNVQHIGDYAFFECTSIGSIVIPDSVVTIGNLSFCGCTKLMNITIGKGLKNVGSGVFNKEASTISTVSGRKFYISDVAQICEMNGSILSSCDSLYVNGEFVSELIIPDGVSKINKEAFYHCRSIYNVVIPDSVIEIGESAFERAGSIRSVIIGNGVKTIGNNAFDTGSSSLTYIEIGRNVEEIGECALGGLGIKTVVVDSGNEHFKTIDNVVYSKDGKTLVYYASGNTDASFVIPNGVTTICEYAFYYAKFKNVEIPDSVTDIGESAFERSALTMVTIPDTVSVIKSRTFFSCTGLISITISKNVTKLDLYAFGYCSSLSTINYDSTIARWELIKKNSFWNNNSGKYIVYCADGTLSK